MWIRGLVLLRTVVHVAMVHYCVPVMIRRVAVTFREPPRLLPRLLALLVVKAL